MSSKQFSLIPFGIGLTLVLGLAHARPTTDFTVIDFDDMVGQPPPFFAGTPVTVLVNDEYLDRGVVFDSSGGGIVVSAPSNPVSPPNTVAATAIPEAPVISYSDPVEATFFVPAVGTGSVPRAGVVDFVALTLSNSSAHSSLEAYDCFGNLLGVDSGGASARLNVEAPGEIHRVVIQQGPMAFDDFTFGGLDVSDFRADQPTPGIAGTDNTFSVCGADPGSTVVFVVGTQPGSSMVPNCTEATFDMADPQVLGTAIVGADSRASVTSFVPVSSNGLLVRVQAAQIGACRVSPLVEHVFASPLVSGTDAPSLLRRASQPSDRPLARPDAFPPVFE